MSVFDNMPDVGKKKLKVHQPSQPNRTLMLLGGLAGCLV